MPDTIKASQPLDVDVQELSGLVAFVPHCRWWRLKVPEAIQTRAATDPRHCGTADARHDRDLAEEISAESVLELYRLRWQVETKFKTLKSVLHLGNPPTRSGELLNVYLAAKLIAVLLIEEFVHRAESFSPWGYPLERHSTVAADATSP